MELDALQQQLLERWYQWKDGRNDWPQLQQSCLPIRLAFETTLQWVEDMGCERDERTPWIQTTARRSKSGGAVELNTSTHHKIQ